MTLDPTLDPGDAGHIEAHEVLHADYNAREGITFATSDDVDAAATTISDALTSHEEATSNPHTAASLAQMITAGGTTLYVSATDPALTHTVVDGDVWIQT